MSHFIEPDPEWAGKFGRSIVEHDEASRRYPVRGVLFQAEAPIVSKTWRRPAAYDQGNKPQCVAFATRGVCNTSPVMTKIPLGIRKMIDTQQVYDLAQKLDPWPGPPPAYDGTSTLAGLKAAHQMGLIPGYRWCFGKDDVLKTLSHYGPVMIGVAWMKSMLTPDSTGLIVAEGDVVGGHCVELNGVDTRKKLVIGTNSWGTGWGVAGRFMMSYETLDALLKNDGEAATVAETEQS